MLIIAGMHRSATTLTARWLQACGLYIGDQLLDSKYNHANPDGNHFEDLDFLNLHKAILLDNGLPANGFITTQVLEVRPHRVDQARQVLAARADYEQWGWKDPRTCLLLDFWREQVPDANMLVIYRHYKNVIDSLLRRKLNHPKPLRRIFYRLRFTPHQRYIRHYLRVWNRYNRDVLSAVEANPERALVLNVADITAQSLQLLDYMNTQWGFQLQPIPLESLLIKDRLKKQAQYVDGDTQGPLCDEFAQADQTLRDLEQWRKISLAQLEQSR